MTGPAVSGIAEPCVIGVIPARYAATRFPGKLLADLGGKPVLLHVHERALLAGLNRVIIATDSEEIRSAAVSFGAEVVMTSPAAPSGTDRIAEAVRDVKFDFVVNIQGDEPFLDPESVRLCVGLLRTRSDASVSTLAERMIDRAEAADPNVVKVVVDARGMALYFSRSLIPFPRDGHGGGSWLRHIGLYVYRREALFDFVERPQSHLEKMEKLEQLRILEAGGRICVLEVEGAGIGIDTKKDLEKARTMLMDGKA